MVWTEPTIERIRVLWADGASCSEIATALSRELQLSVTKNAVIGIIHRRGLGAPRRRRQPALSPPRPRRQKIQRVKCGFHFDTAEPSAPEPMPLTREDDLLIPIAQRRGVLGLTYSTCRWPVGDPTSSDFFFCGGKVLSGEVYCHGHCRRAYNGFGAWKGARQKEPECTGQ